MSRSSKTTLSRRDQVEDDLRTVAGCAGHSRPLASSGARSRSSSEVACPSRSALRWMALAPTPIWMVGTRSMPLLRIGAPIDADVETGECQMPVLASEPAIALLDRTRSCRRPRARRRSCRHRLRSGLAILTDHRDLLRPETRLRSAAAMSSSGGHADCRVRRDRPSRRPALRASDLLGTKSRIERDVLLGRQLDRQSDDELLGELRIGAFLEVLDLVPEGFDCPGDRAIGDQRPHPVRRVRWQQELLMERDRACCE